MSDLGIRLEVLPSSRVCFAMQQASIPWLPALRIHNDGPEPWRDVVVRLELTPGGAGSVERRFAELPAGGSVEVDHPEPPLDRAALGNRLERERAALTIEVVAAAEAGERTLAGLVADVDLLAYNEWPGLDVLPALLAAFVVPNHPVLVPTLQAVADRLEAATGLRSLDGYQSGDARRARAIAEAVYGAVAAAGITYVNPPPSFERQGQKVRTPEQVLGGRFGTCLDLALLHAALLELAGLAPFVVMQRGHAFVGVWLVDANHPQPELAPAVELRKRCDLGAALVWETTMAVAGATADFAAAAATARRALDDDAKFVVAIDVAAARRFGISPLPIRTEVFAPVAVEDVPPAVATTGAVSAAPAPVLAAAEPEAARVRPQDRLEHWRTKLLDLSMWNRLLNFAPTKKSVPLSGHDLAALEDRFQSGARLRVLGKPELGGDGDPRDLDARRERTGVDLPASFLADELRAGRLRSPLDAEELDARLVEIFRHARSTLEESGANTLHLAIGYLRWYETPQSDKPRRAPLLLLPLVAERSSVRDGVRFVLDDAEPRINQTLLELLRRQFRIEVEIGDALPEDEQGLDVARILDAFRVAALGMPRWEVENTACIGFFSFAKYLMWLDLASRDELLASPVLRHLVQSPGATYEQVVAEPTRESLDSESPVDLLCPKDADSSQLAAVLAAARGRTFVLEGPPGTGKSQTITNLIVQSLADGKRVLFVAEKRAALEVVQRRLDEVGIAPFALELHSSKSGPRAALDQFKRTLEFGARREPADWRATAEALAAKRDALNAFVGALHARREPGLTPFEAMGRLVALRDAPTVAWPAIAVDDAAAVGALRTAITGLVAAAKPLGVPCRAPWWGIGNGEWLPALGRNLSPQLAPLRDAALAYRHAAERFAAVVGLRELLGATPSRARWTALEDLLEMVAEADLPPGTLVAAPDRRTVEAALRDAIERGRRRDERWRGLAARWREGLLQLDLADLAVRFLRAADGFFLVRWWQLRGPRRELAGVAVDGRVGAARAVIADLEVAREVVDLQRAVAGHDAVGRLLGDAWRDGRADWARIERWLARGAALCDAAQRAAGGVPPTAATLGSLAELVERARRGDAELLAAAAALREARFEWAAKLRAVDELLQLQVDDAFVAATTAGWFDAVEARIGRWLAALPNLREHCAYVRAATAAQRAGAGAIVAAHARGEPANEHLEAAVERAHLLAWTDALHAAEPELARFAGRDHERAIDEFARLDRRHMALSAEVVAARLAARLPQLRGTTVATSELGMLERELKKQRRHKPVRRLLAELPGLLPRLAPCLLMSPLSVVQYLGKAAAEFDLVVFDEASQMPVWDAVPALGRGRAAIVVGDSRQLPPTSFFQRQEQGDEPRDDELPEDLESVLDECAAAGLPRMHLAWHYRSRHESLIAFSNRHYYDNRLLTFPAPADVAPGRGVRLVRVDGVYDRGASGTNRREAEALVADVVARLRNAAHAPLTLGIVTFSQPQQKLVEDLLDRARQESPELEPHFTRQHEPVFVKNLENVQGDERDVILFSICYGPDALGKYHENYGPINARGGERRLNVAVTRARHELVVYASMGAEHVANRSQALGARHLRAFLDYAARGAAALNAHAAPTGGGVESPLEAAVRDELVRRGHEVHTQVGCGGYRIDLAIVDPRAPGRYLLGIECDGATYHSAATARDRDRLRSAVLRGLGWRLCRVWSTDFWQDAATELDRVEAAIAEALADPLEEARPQPFAGAVPTAVDPAASTATEHPAQPSADLAAEVAAEKPAEPPAELPIADATGPRPYVAAVLDRAGDAEAFARPGSDRKVAAAIAAVVAVEAPVTFDRLARTVADAFGVGRVTERVRERIRRVLPLANCDGGEVVWADPADLAEFVGFRTPGADPATVRSVEEVPGIEVENAMRWLLRQHGAMAADDLARETARQFGISRLGAVVREHMDAALAVLVENGVAQRDGDVVRTADG